MKRNTLYITILLVFVYAFAKAQTTDPAYLVNVQKASQLEIDAYDPADLEIGMLVYNTDENRIFEYTNNGFLELLTEKNIYTGWFIISGEGVVTVSDIPFTPSQVTFSAAANVESRDIDSDNGTGNNDRGINNSYGTMNGFANDTGATLVQQVTFVGGHGNSINDISRYASSSNCIGVRYGDQNGSSLGKIEAAFGAFTADGFTVNVNYTDGVITVNSTNALVDIQPDDVNNEALLVIFTAYK
ncbi:hypothetical protein [Dokdonia sp. 4H-3-7-5]|uniref:hypothetical protein n=1 Tax=Dokdonia sp. (strain 4H-3-7-5) TaxID=983548 RepID=UPI00020A6B9B|nr:hypothetical protein [Dokdonia sp. 4H-3-7-5]AEE18526.1 hypothetical protein Krodi_0541 [Dokdonia sp. 4H-3-7-5]